MTTTESIYNPNYTHSIVIEDSRRNHESEVFVQSFDAAIKKLEKLHQWAKENGYGPGEYSLTLNTI